VRKQTARRVTIYKTPKLCNRLQAFYGGQTGLWHGFFGATHSVVFFRQENLRREKQDKIREDLADRLIEPDASHSVNRLEKHPPHCGQFIESACFLYGYAIISCN
jgi:hypothetical protein